MAEGTGVEGSLWPHAHTYLQGRQRRGEITINTIRNSRSVLAGLSRSYGNRPVERFATAAVDRWLESTAHQKPSTRAAGWTIVAGFTRWLLQQQLIPADPCEGRRGPKRPRTEPRALEHDAVARLLFVAPDARAQAIIWLEVGLGLRRVEVHRLRVEDWLRRDRLVRVVGKGGHERTVPMIREAERVLDAYLRECPATVGPLIRSTTDPSRPLSLSSLSHYMATWMTAAGIKHAPRDGVNGHALRHTAASDVLDRCGDLRVVQEMLGHRNLATTAVYLRRSQLGAIREAMEGRTYREVRRAAPSASAS